MIDLSLLSDGGLGWLEGSGPHHGMVLSTRVRLARNVAGFPFTGRNTAEEREEILKVVARAAAETASLGRAVRFRLDQMDHADRVLLLERHLVSRDLVAAEGGEEGGGAARTGSAVVVQDTLSAMVNEEDHLRLQGVLSGFAPEAAYAAVSGLDAELGQRLAFAFHPEFGYLTACPTNVGTGLRASVLIHLPGLVLTKEISRVLQGLGQVGLTSRGLYGEGSEVIGNFFQLSNQTTLGKSEPELLDHLGKIVRKVMGYEEQARRVLQRDAPGVLDDKVWRAYGLLRYARALSFEETMSLLSGVRLGVGLGLIPDVGMYTLNRLLVLTQPAHLAAAASAELDDPDRAVRRAEFVRGVLATEENRRDDPPGGDSPASQGDA